jgi:hypothetical protein
MRIIGYSKRTSLNRALHLSLLVFIIFLVCVNSLIGVLKFPELYMFSADNQSLLSRVITSPIHLYDDVMISLRSGYMLQDTGIPSFNKVDLANPSTSYLSPYLFAALIEVLPLNLAVASYALIGFILVLISLSLIIVVSQSRFNGLFLVTCLVFSSTFRQYSLNGWDHLFSSFFLLLAAYFSLEDKIRLSKVLLISVMIFLGVGFRPDGLIIGLAIIASYYLKTREVFRTISISVIVLGMLVAILLQNQSNFGHFTPTTARLKLGSVIPLRDKFDYIVNNGLLTFSSISILFFSLTFVIIFKRFFPRYSMALVFGSVISGLYAFYVSDVFSAARMFWTSSNVLVLLIAMYAPKVLKNATLEARELNSDYLNPIFSNKVFKILKNGFIGALLLVVCINLGANTRAKLGSLGSIVRSEVSSSPTASQFVVAQWVNQNLDPSDGAVGLYMLGIGFHMPTFEIADFLGKADELIASQPSKWGPPGHNKWDTEASIRKWSPQLIIPAERDMLAISKAQATDWLQEKRWWAFVPDLRLSKSLASSYSYCRIVANQADSNVGPWGFYLRNNIIARGHESITCVDAS